MIVFFQKFTVHYIMNALLYKIIIPIYFLSHMFLRIILCYEDMV